MTKVETDVLIAGGGGAGFRAAIAARAKGLKVLLVSKGPLARSGASPMAGADYTLDGRSMSRIDGLKGDPNDSEEKVFNDIVTQGCFLNNQKLVEQYVRVAPSGLKDLLEWGIKVKLSDERMIFTSGTGIMDALLRKARDSGVEFAEDVQLLDLAKSGDRIAGAFGLNVRTGELIQFECKAVVMATGGWHKAFWPNTGMRDLSGDGIAMAYRAGAELGNMEFITFCCNVFLDPPMWLGSIAPYMMGILIGHKLTNREGVEFLKAYDPELVRYGTFTEWNKSFISHATAREVLAGRGSPHGGVYFARGDAPFSHVERVVEIVFPRWKYKAIDLTDWGTKLRDNEPAEVGSAVEYFDGGIVINDRFETSVPGLFAAGECALGVFGANRVFSAITEMLVQGAEAGSFAADYALEEPSTDPIRKELVDQVRGKVEAPLTRAKGSRPAEARRRIQEAAHQHLGPIRSAQGLRLLEELVRSMRREELPRLAPTSATRIYNKEWIDAIELENILQLLEVSARSALERTESRGVHYREDFPLTDNDRWLKEIVVRRDGEGLRLDRRGVVVAGMTPPSGVTPYLEFMKRMMLSHSDTKGKH